MSYIDLFNSIRPRRDVGPFRPKPQRHIYDSTENNLNTSVIPPISVLQTSVCCKIRYENCVHSVACGLKKKKKKNGFQTIFTNVAKQIRSNAKLGTYEIYAPIIKPATRTNYNLPTNRVVQS